MSPRSPARGTHTSTARAAARSGQSGANTSGSRTPGAWRSVPARQKSTLAMNASPSSRPAPSPPAPAALNPQRRSRAAASVGCRLGA
jgi:hypothetical protein